MLQYVLCTVIMVTGLESIACLKKTVDWGVNYIENKKMCNVCCQSSVEKLENWECV